MTGDGDGNITVERQFNSKTKEDRRRKLLINYLLELF